MLSFGNVAKTDSAQIAAIRMWVTEILDVSGETHIMVRQLECREPGCPPLETVMAVLSEHQPPRQWKIYKSAADVTRADVECLLAKDYDELKPPHGAVAIDESIQVRTIVPIVHASMKRMLCDGPQQQPTLS